MVNGVKVIEETTKIINETQNTDLASFAIVGIMVVCTVISVLILMKIMPAHSATNHKMSGKEIARTLVLAFSPVWGLCLGGIIACTCIEKHVTVGEEHIYEVTISDDVSFNSIADNYEILECDGNTYKISKKVMYENAADNK